MKNTRIFGVILFLLLPLFSENNQPAINLENLTWVEAEKVLQDYEVVMIALGARTKEHGPHLPLNNDYIMAEYLKKRVAQEVPVVVLPTLQYGYYPAFLDYPGSVSIKSETQMNVIMDICLSFHGYGIKKFYVLNTGVSTLRPLRKAQELLKQKQITLHFLDILAADERLPKDLLEQEGGTHADEGETSMMLYIAPDKVDMSKAVKDYDPRPNRPGLSRYPEGKGSYSPTGIWGDPTLATREKGEIIVENTIQVIVEEITELIKKKN